MAGAKVKETVTKSLGNLRNEMMTNCLRRDAKSRASYFKAKKNRYSGKTQEDWGDQERIKP